MERLSGRNFIFIGLGFSLISLIPAPIPPKATLSNEIISAELYLPDAEKGYYQGTRFDQSGLVNAVRYGNHRYFGQWFENYSPKTHDAVTGPVEAFDPIGYDQAAPGGNFLKIGVGMLKKANAAYEPFHLYEISNPGKWTINHSNNRITFLQELSDTSGYGFSYNKTISLEHGKAVLIIDHTLRNKGRKVIETSVFDHNFPMIDTATTGPALRIVFPFNLTAEGKGWGTLARVDGKAIEFLTNLSKGQQVYSPSVTGFSKNSTDYDIKIENLRSHAGLRIQGNRPMEKLVFWAINTTACPEPYTHLKVMPGEETTWRITYTFYNLTSFK